MAFLCAESRIKPSSRQLTNTPKNTISLFDSILVMKFIFMLADLSTFNS